MSANEASTKGRWDGWGKDLSISLIAALAVLVSGGVSAFVSWQTTTRTLESQATQATYSYVRDSQKAVYTDVLQKNASLGTSIDQLVQDAYKVRTGDWPKIPVATIDNVKKKRDEFAYATHPMFIVGAKDTARQTVLITDRATNIFQTAYSINDQAEEIPANQVAVQTKAKELLDFIVFNPDTGDLVADLMRLMRRDLGVPD